MRWGAINFLLGILVSWNMYCTGNWRLAVPAIVLTLMLLRYRFSYWRWGLWFLAGFFWLWWYLHLVLSWQLPLAWQQKPLVVVATIVSIPEQQDEIVSFMAATQQVQGVPQKTRIKLDWYRYHQQALPLSVGQQWQFTVKLKRPHNYQNPGSFDYNAWLLTQDIRATGYVVNAKLLQDNHNERPLDRLRAAIQAKIYHALPGQAFANFIVALTVGVRENITPAQWQILQNTGTNHLIAIAGLHIGLMTGLVFFLVGFIWRRLPLAPLWLATPRVAAAAALLMAWVYAGLAGFTIPTQRAVVMTTVFMLSIMFREKLQPWFAWSLSLLVVLVLNPLTILSEGLWLSFIAVALIIFVISGRVGSQGKFLRLAKIQLILGLGLLPITLLFFHNASLIAPIANLIVIPIVGFLTVPLSLLGILCFTISNSAAHLALWCAAYTMQYAWDVLSFFSAHSYLSWQSGLSLVNTATILIGIVILLMPRGIPGRYLAFCFLAPLWCQVPTPLAYGTLKLTVLDVGQGLSVVVRTQHHALIYDTGAKYSPTYDMGTAVVIPYLQVMHLQQIDRIVISHGDNDHIGGLPSILQQYPVANIISSVPQRIHNQPPAQLCLAGQQWQWDGVQFAVLYPDKQHLGLDNNSSCVVQISAGRNKVLLTGDIERPAEQWLVQQYHEQLASAVLVAPHHGSRTSSSPLFLRYVQPQWVVFATGYLNRFHFPSTAVVTRYQQLSVAAYNTADTGATDFTITSTAITADPYQKRNSCIN